MAAAIVGPVAAGAQVSGEYMDYRAFTSAVQGLANAHSGLARVSSLAGTEGARDVWLLTLGSNEGRPLDQRPALLIVANLEANRIAGSHAALRIAEWMVEGYGSDPGLTEVLDTRTIYLVPWANPDRAELIFTLPGQETAYKPFQVDASRGGLNARELGRDLNGDGQVTLMRFEGPPPAPVSSTRTMRVCCVTPCGRGPSVGRTRCWWRAQRQAVHRSRTAVDVDLGTGAVHGHLAVEIHLELRHAAEQLRSHGAPGRRHGGDVVRRPVGLERHDRPFRGHRERVELHRLDDERECPEIMGRVGLHLERIGHEGAVGEASHAGSVLAMRTSDEKQAPGAAGDAARGGRVAHQFQGDVRACDRLAGTRVAHPARHFGDLGHEPPRGAPGRTPSSRRSRSVRVGSSVSACLAGCSARRRTSVRGPKPGRLVG